MAYGGGAYTPHTQVDGVYGALHLDVQKRRQEDEDMKGVGRRGDICPLCFDTSRRAWKAGRGYMAAAQTRDICGGTRMRSAASDGPSGRKAAQEGVYLIERAEETLVAVLRE